MRPCNGAGECVLVISIAGALVELHAAYCTRGDTVYVDLSDIRNNFSLEYSICLTLLKPKLITAIYNLFWIGARVDHHGSLLFYENCHGLSERLFLLHISTLGIRCLIYISYIWSEIA